MKDCDWHKIMEDVENELSNIPLSDIQGQKRVIIEFLDLLGSCLCEVQQQIDETKKILADHENLPANAAHAPDEEMKEK
jgi:hypothetical protein